MNVVEVESNVVMNVPCIFSFSLPVNNDDLNCLTDFLPNVEKMDVLTDFESHSLFSSDVDVLVDANIISRETVSHGASDVVAASSIFRHSTNTISTTGIGIKDVFTSQTMIIDAKGVEGSVTKGDVLSDTKGVLSNTKCVVSSDAEGCTNIGSRCCANSLRVGLPRDTRCEKMFHDVACMTSTLFPNGAISTLEIETIVGKAYR